MGNFPCPTLPVACPGTDSPFLNLSAELPDELKYFGYKFFTNTGTFCESTDPAIVDACDPPLPSNPPPPHVFVSNAQTCAVVCEDMSVSEYTAVAGSAVGFTQEEADAIAYAFACDVAAILCFGTPTIFLNERQSCARTCLGRPVSYTTPPGTFAGVTQDQANLLATQFACSMVSQLCLSPAFAGSPPLGGGAPAGPAVPLFGNVPQSCSVPCPDGSRFTLFVGANNFFAESTAIANGIAYSYACQQAQAQRVCLSNIPAFVCTGEFFIQFLEATGLSNPVFTLVNGALPTGTALDPAGVISGTPTGSGSANFTIRATGDGGHYTQRDYSIALVTVSASGGLGTPTVGIAFTQVFEADGFTAGASWAITAGVLPGGLTLLPGGGVNCTISGTPTESGSFPFTLTATDGDQHCSKQFTFEVVGLVPLVYWALEGVTPPSSQQALCRTGYNTTQTFEALTEETGGPVTSTFGKKAFTTVHGTVGSSGDSRWNQSSGSCRYKGQFSTYPVGMGSDSFSGRGWSIAVWFRSFTLDLVSPLLQILKIHYTSKMPAGRDILIDLRYRVSGAGFQAHRIETNSLILEGVPFASVDIAGQVDQDNWNLLVVRFTPSTVSVNTPGVLHYSLNGDPFAVLNASCTLTATVDGDTGELDVWGDDCFFDEVAMFNSILTNQELAYLYNGGSGRTFASGSWVPA